MVIRNEYRIAHKGLKNGKHNFEFNLGSTFFEKFEKSNIGESDFEVALDLERRDSIYLALFEVTGTYKALCDRCHAEIDVPLNAEEKVIFKLAEEGRVEDEIVYIPHQENFIDLEDQIYQIIHVHMPFQNLRPCDEEGHKYCDIEALKILDGSELGEEKNVLWDNLKDIKIK